MGIFNFFKKQNDVDKNYINSDTILFGKYYFENEKSVQPIEWVVLENSDTDMLLISKYCLDTIKYCESSSSHGGTECCIWENFKYSIFCFSCISMRYYFKHNFLIKIFR